MLPVYELHWPFNDEPSTLPDRNVVSSWSKDNWIALTPGFQKEERKFSERKFQFSNDIVCILNPNEPWEVFTLKTHGGNIEQLLWDEAGKHFLTVDSKGILKVWKKDNDFINDWVVFKQVDVSQHDRVVEMMSVQHNTKTIDNEQIFTTKDASQKFISSKNKLFTRTSIENINAVLVVTSSGLLKLIVLKDDFNEEKDIIVARLGSINLNVLRAHMSINEYGKLFVALQTNHSIIELFTVLFKEVNSTITMVVEAWPCIVPHLNNTQFQNLEIQSLKTVCINFSDYVIVNCKGNGTSSIQIFEIKKEQVFLHPVFPTSNQHSQQSDTAVCLKTFQFSSDIISINTTNIKYSNMNSSVDRQFSPKLIAIDSKHTLYIFSLTDYTQVGKFDNLNIAGDILSVNISPCDHAMFIMTSYSMYMFTIPYLNAKDALRISSTILQYCLHSNIHPWAVMCYLSSFEISQIEHVHQSVIQDFNDQSSMLQHLLFKSFCNIKSMFYQISGNGCGVASSYNLLMFRQIYAYILSNTVNENDSKVVEVIKKVCSSKKDLDILKLVQVFDTKDTNLTVLLELSNRPLIQWLYDYAMYIIRLILSTHYHGQNWKTILKYFDPTTFLYLRELFLLFYILYQKNPNLLNVCPVFVTMATTVDITVHLFKVFTKIYQLSLGETAIDLSMTDLPFSTLPLMYLEISSYTMQQNVLSMSKKSKHSKNEYEIQTKQVEWNYIQQLSIKNPLAIGVTTINTTYRQVYDAINLIHASLMNGELVKQCCNCNALTVYNVHATRTLNINWKELFQAHCFCGGMWKKVDRPIK